ncbi:MULTISPECIES: head maturation protease, ClpP-related [Acidaminococcus]|jgi:ATP-dependent Clp protease protease subunit|uniref:head maturation protease, ClpP-related n=1 Tax=Acidaminococcus TaxID=904 RepID=UPI000E73202A|nr:MULTISPECIES: head maturation protease, ClpP-related [Acidaminococcus]RJU39207.1 Clp protease ClpP [Acidaminococcus sp. AM33-14BH]
MNRKFWNWVKNSVPDEFGNTRTLYLDGQISEETWWGDEVTPEAFRKELFEDSGDITLWINSPGGDCFAAAQIYNMLMEYPGKITVKIDGLAASAASVIAMAGSRVCMSPVAILMIHNPATVAMGDTEAMKKAIGMLNEVKESIINAYELKSGMDRAKISKMMDSETWLNAKKAVELGFADEVLYGEASVPEGSRAMLYTPITVTNSFVHKLEPKKTSEGRVKKTLASDLEHRLALLIH